MGLVVYCAKHIFLLTVFGLVQVPSPPPSLVSSIILSIFSLNNRPPPSLTSPFLVPSHSSSIHYLDAFPHFPSPRSFFIILPFFSSVINFFLLSVLPSSYSSNLLSSTRLTFLPHFSLPRSLSLIFPLFLHSLNSPSLSFSRPLYSSHPPFVVHSLTLLPSFTSPVPHSLLLKLPFSFHSLDGLPSLTRGLAIDPSMTWPGIMQQQGGGGRE